MSSPMTAYIEGLEQAAVNGQTLAGVASVASFLVSCVDTEIDKRLEKIGTDEALALRGKAGVVNSRLVYAAFQKVFQGTLCGAHRAGREAAADTVNTMPEKTLLAFADHGEAQGDKVTAPPRGHRRCSTPSNASASKPRLVSE